MSHQFGSTGRYQVHGSRRDCNGEWHPPDRSPGPGWWLANDDVWYPSAGWWLASDGKWYPPQATPDASSDHDRSTILQAEQGPVIEKHRRNPWRWALRIAAITASILTYVVVDAIAPDADTSGQWGASDYVSSVVFCFVSVPLWLASCRRRFKLEAVDALKTAAIAAPIIFLTPPLTDPILR